MKTVSVTQAKNGLSALIDQVKAGESILILDRGIPVARLEPVGDAADTDARLRRLERAGLVRIGTGKLPDDFFTTRGPELPEGASLVDAVLEERREGW